MNLPIAVEVTGLVRATPERTFGVFAPIDLRSILRPFGPLPGVAAVEDQTGAWDAPGQTRTLVLSDGSALREELLVVEAPHHFAYRVTQIGGGFRHLVREMHGAWWFSAAPGAAPDVPYTHARWRYDALPRSAAARLPAALVLRTLWRRQMARALDLARHQAEARERLPAGAQPS